MNDAAGQEWPEVAAVGEEPIEELAAEVVDLVAARSPMSADRVDDFLARVHAAVAERDQRHAANLSDREMLVLELRRSHDFATIARRLRISVVEAAQIEVDAQAKLDAADGAYIDEDLVVALPPRRELILAGRAALAAVGIDPDDLVDAETDAELRSAVPENTVALMAWAWGRFVRYCMATGRRWEEPTVATLRQYIKDHWYMTDQHGQPPGRRGRPYAPKTVETAVYLIASICNRRGWYNPVRNPLVNDQMKAYRRRYEQAGHRSDESDPLTDADSVIMARACNLGTVYGLRNAAMFRAQFDMGCRAAELCSVQLQDVQWLSGERVVIRFVESNTKVRKQREVGLQANLARNPDVDPVVLLRKLCDELAAAGRTSGPLFPKVFSPGAARSDFAQTGILAGRWRDEAIDYTGYALAFDRVVDETGLERDGEGNMARHLTSHSSRSGLITAGIEARVPAEVIAMRTGHNPSSPSFGAYFRSGRRWDEANAGFVIRGGLGEQRAHGQ